jgi:iron complex outermembrane receptor protein
MKQHRYAMLTSSSILALASAITAHAADGNGPTSSEGTASDIIEEIIITAERRPERLQDAPVSVDVVTSQDIEKYNVFQFEDIQKLVPGLQLLNVGNGFATTASMRGVTYDENQAVPPTVSFYLNDAPVDSNFLFQSIYDVGQIEVLRGPQGTIRGEISPSGSITVSTRRPDLDQFGGYVSGTVGTLQDTNLQGALNFPIVQDKFAIRVAGTRNEDSVNGVKSLVNPSSPNEITNAGRISARFAPNDDIDAVVTYQHLVHNQHSYESELVGSGAPGGLVPGTTNTPAPPAGYNGPVIGPNQLLTVDPSPTYVNQRLDDVEALADWSFRGQKLSYVGSWNRLNLLSVQSSDTGNAIPGYDVGGITTTVQKQWTQELRLSSVQPLFGRLDYTGGFFYFNANVAGEDVGGPRYFAFDFAPSLIPQPPKPGAFVLSTPVSVPSNKFEYAGYASLTFHVDKKTEITGGIRYSRQELDYVTTVSFKPPVIKPEVEPANHWYNPVIYNVEASHHFTDDLMAYVRVGNSFRPGNLQIATVLGGATTPALQPFIFPSPEKSTTYEVGIKSAFFNKKLVLDIDYYHQDYKGLFYSPLPFYYLNTSIVPGVAPAVATANLITDNAPAKVDGIEFNGSALITPHWTATGVFSWANGHLSNASIPCNPPVAGVPTVAYFQSLNEFYNTCRSSTSTTSAPRWNANVQSQYDQPINPAMNAFIRGLVYYYPSNPFSSTTYVVPAYATLDLYLGLRNPASLWEASLYGKNIADDRTVTRLDATQVTTPFQAFFGNTGYYMTSHTPRREFGLTLRYAFGSR